MKKPFFQLALEALLFDVKIPETVKQSVFLSQLKVLKNTLEMLGSKRRNDSEKAQLKIKLFYIFEETFQALIFAENAFWYQKLLKLKLPKLYENHVFLSGIHISEDFKPVLIFEIFQLADSLSPVCKLSELLTEIYRNVHFSETSLYKIQRLEQASLKNAHLISKIDEVCGVDMMSLQNEFKKLLLGRKNGKW